MIALDLFCLWLGRSLLTASLIVGALVCAGLLVNLAANLAVRAHRRWQVGCIVARVMLRARCIRQGANRRARR